MSSQIFVSQTKPEIWIEKTQSFEEIKTFSMQSPSSDYGRGWGLHAESFDFFERLRLFYPDFWFGLGDKDLATHVWRSELLRDGRSLSELTTREARLCGVQSRIIPATDSWVETQIETVSHTILHYEEYFIRLKCEPSVSQVRY